MYKLKKYERVDNRGEFNPNEPIKVTFTLKDKLLTTSPYKIKLYRNHTNNIDDLEIVNRQACIIYDSILDISKNDLTQFERVFIEPLELESHE